MTMQEDWILVLFQHLVTSIADIEWTSHDENKLSIAQNLACVDKYYKRWREVSNNKVPRSPKPLPNTPALPPASPTTPTSPSTPTSRSSSVSPPHHTPFGSSSFYRKLDVLDISDNSDYNTTLSSSPTSTKSSPTSTWTSPDLTRPNNKPADHTKKKQIEILNFTIDSKFKAIKELVERIAKSINEKRNVNFVVLWLLIENRNHVDQFAYKTGPILELISHFKREVRNGLNNIDDDAEGKLDDKPQIGNGFGSNSYANGTYSSLRAAADAQEPMSKSVSSRPGWQKFQARPNTPDVLKEKESRLPPSPMLRTSKASEIMKEGWMKKKKQGGKNKKKDWTRRYFILSSEGILAYFECTRRMESQLPSLSGSFFGNSLGKMKGSLDLFNATQIGNIRDADVTMPVTCMFGIETPQCTLRLWCDSEKDMEEWLEVLLRLRSQARY